MRSREELLTILDDWVFRLDQVMEHSDDEIVCAVYAEMADVLMREQEGARDL